jgi:MFS superfamily sulfate permease-like transporter
VAGILLNTLGSGSLQPLDVVGVLILLVLTAIALVLAKLVPVVPSSIWVLALATLASATFLPVGPFIASATQHINVLFAGLPMIALIGMSLGRDVKALRSLSWKIVIVALITFTASFLAAAVIAELAFQF